MFARDSEARPRSPVPHNERHHVELYSDDATFLRRLADYVLHGLVSGEPVVIIATPEHRQSLATRLRERWIDVDAAIARGTLLLLDAEETLDRFMVNGTPDPARFEASLLPVLDRAAGHGNGRPVRAFGEMVDLLFQRDACEEALCLEELWEALSEQRAFSLLCAYRTDRATSLSFLRRVYEVHRRINHLIPDAEDFRLLVESVHDYAIFMLDADGRVISWNPGAERMKGYRAEEIIGEHFSRFYPEEDVRAGKCGWELRQAVELGRFEDEGWRVRSDGSRFWANVVITAMRDRNGRHIGFAKVTRDLTERKNAQERLAEEQVARGRAEAERAASDERLRLGKLYAGVLAHDLRSPLSAILTAAQFTQQISRDARVGRTQERLVTSASRMRRMIDQLLDFTRVRLGTGVELQRSPMNLGVLAAQLVRETEEAVGRAIHLVQTGTLSGEWDGDRLAQVLSNLLTNAADHGRSGAPIRLLLDGTDPDSVRLETHNLGEVPPELLPSIFEPFRGSGSQRGAERGLGLGLFIARELVRLHGGTIEVSSSAEDGTRFRVELPRFPPADSPPFPGATTARSA